MPKPLQSMEQPLRLVSYGPQIDEFIVGMNRAAEKAVPFAGVDFLHKIVPPKLISEAILMRQRNAEGFKTGNITYGSAFQVVPNLTYVLRSISYKQPDFLYEPYPSRRDGIAAPGDHDSALIPSISQPVYQGADVLIAFRVVRQEDDQGVTILWKRLHKSSAPELRTAVGGRVPLPPVEGHVRSVSIVGRNRDVSASVPSSVPAFGPRLMSGPPVMRADGMSPS